MNYFEITKECENILSILFFIRELLKIVCILVPIGLIVMLTMDIAKGVISGKEEGSKIVSIITKRLVYAIVIFFLPETIFGVMGFLLNNQTNESYACWKFAGETSIKEVKNIMKAQEEALIEQINKLDEETIERNREREAVRKQFEGMLTNITNSTQSSGSTSDGIYLGQTYDLTDDELRGIAYLCQLEQTTPIGASAEATLIANRFELYGVPYASLYKYVENSGWWGEVAHVKPILNNHSGANQDVVDAVKEVLVYGKRIFPLYVDEHDCIWCGEKGWNVTHIDNNGEIITNANRDAILNHKNYIPGVTKIYNTYTSVYTFHSFLSDYIYADPFGYTDEGMAKFKKLQGEE